MVGLKLTLEFWLSKRLCHQFFDAVGRPGRGYPSSFTHFRKRVPATCKNQTHRVLDHTLAPASQVKARKPRNRINSLTTQLQSPEVGGDLGWFRGVGGPRHGSPGALAAEAPTSRTAPGRVLARWAHCETWRPVVWSIRASYLRERRCGAAAATPWKPQGCPKTAASGRGDFNANPAPDRCHVRRAGSGLPAHGGET